VNGAWRPQYTPKLKKRTALLRKLKDIFGRSRSQPVHGVIQQINPILRGWVNYFRAGHATRCFSYVRDWVEKKVRWHLMRNMKRRGLGWQRWRQHWFYTTLGLFNDYHVCYQR
jgi:RNA-directed DNA polymerase